MRIACFTRRTGRSVEMAGSSRFDHHSMSVLREAGHCQSREFMNSYAACGPLSSCRRRIAELEDPMISALEADRSAVTAILSPRFEQRRSYSPDRIRYERLSVDRNVQADEPRKAA